MKKPLIMDDQDAYKADAAKVNVEILAALCASLPHLPHNSPHHKDVLHPVQSQVRGAIKKLKGNL